MKKILLSLFVGLIGLINFGFCDTVGTLLQNNNIPNIAIDTSRRSILVDLGYDEEYTVCFRLYGHTNSTVNIGISQNNYSPPDAYVNYYRGWAGQYYCIFKSINDGYLVAKSMNSTDNIYGDYFILNDLLEENLPELTESECKQKYNLMSVANFTSLNCQQSFSLIPISSVDENYCVNNGLCPSSDCPDIPGSGDNWSALYINDIQHLGKPIINITFPDYLDWDYTTDDTEFNLDIVGYPVDTEYIDGIIRTQNYKPTSEDFTQLVGMLAPYSKYLLFLLFIFIIWAWIKKPFKSKKL